MSPLHIHDDVDGATGVSIKRFVNGVTVRAVAVVGGSKVEDSESDDDSEARLLEAESLESCGG